MDQDKDRKDHVRVVRWVRRTVGVTWLTEEELLRAAQLVDLHAHDTVSARPGQREVGTTPSTQRGDVCACNKGVLVHSATRHGRRRFPVKR